MIYNTRQEFIEEIFKKGEINNQQVILKLNDIQEIADKIFQSGMKCDICGKISEDVSYRPDSYAQDVGNDSSAYHTVCDKCDNECIMDI